ncbi:MAG: hypothetical protein FWE86_02175 [Oscillospiraceae bacterium]|nr:hypothetical protein [Oscillospiraceae bacterium]
MEAQKKEKTKKKGKVGLILGLSGGAVVAVALVLAYLFFFYFTGDNLLSLADKCADDGRDDLAVMLYEKYIEEDPSNAAGYLRLVKLYNGEDNLEKRAETYHRLVEFAEVDAENIYIKAMNTMIEAGDYEGARLANEKGMERFGETQDLHPIWIYCAMNTIYVGQKLRIDISYPADTPIPTMFEFDGALLYDDDVLSASESDNGDQYVICDHIYIVGQRVGECVLNIQTIAGENISVYYEVADDYAERVLAAINELRTDAGKKKLKPNEKLQRAAEIRLEEWCELPGYTRPNGKLCWNVRSDVGLPASNYWEFGFDGSDWDWWFTSPEDFMENFWDDYGKKEFKKAISVGAAFKFKEGSYAPVFVLWGHF